MLLVMVNLYLDYGVSGFCDMIIILFGVSDFGLVDFLGE